MVQQVDSGHKRTSEALAAAFRGGLGLGQAAEGEGGPGHPFEAAASLSLRSRPRVLRQLSWEVVEGHHLAEPSG
jgi:hypothetical protein